MRQVVGFDIDGVLADFTTGWRYLAQREYGCAVWSNGRQRTWKHADLSGAQEAHLWACVDDHPAWWLTLDPLVTPGEVEDMRALARSAEIAYVTSRKDVGAVRAQTERWLREMALPHGELYLDHPNKGELMASMPTLAFIDDAPHNLRKLLACGVSAYVRDWQYNRPPHVHVDVPRVYSVGEYIDRLLG